MAGFVEGCDTGQSTLFPAMFDDYIDKDNPVRAIDVFIDGLDLGTLKRVRPDGPTMGQFIPGSNPDRG